ncbi:hypothetical protein SO694_00001324 [Aureococcus anophagefferens]|uniref:Nucleotide-diphospho-sugar transferase domain-containing protein n=1 Tax=Aureococcus anophagefferens TaxID=44056 RepID=A0ABR1GBD8_AURAN
MLPFGAASNLTAELRALDATLALLERRLRPRRGARHRRAAGAGAAAAGKRPRDIDARLRGRRRGGASGGPGGGGDAAAFRGLDARLRRVEAAVAAGAAARAAAPAADAPAAEAPATPRARPPAAPSNAPPAPAPTQGPGYRARRLAFNESLPRLPAPVSPAASGPAARVLSFSGILEASRYVEGGAQLGEFSVSLFLRSRAGCLPYGWHPRIYAYADYDRGGPWHVGGCSLLNAVVGRTAPAAWRPLWRKRRACCPAAPEDELFAPGGLGASEKGERARVKDVLWNGPRSDWGLSLSETTGRLLFGLFRGCLSDVQIHRRAWTARDVAAFHAKRPADATPCEPPRARGMPRPTRARGARARAPIPVYYLAHTDAGSLAMRDAFVASVKDAPGDLELREVLAGDLGASQKERYGPKGQLIHRALTENPAGTLVVVADIDIRFFRPLAPLLEAYAERRSADAVFQRDADWSLEANLGLMALRCSARVDAFFAETAAMAATYGAGDKATIKRQNSGVKGGDQRIVNVALKNPARVPALPAISWALLPHELTTRTIDLQRGMMYKHEEATYGYHLNDFGGAGTTPEKARENKMAMLAQEEAAFKEETNKAQALLIKYAQHPPPWD